MLNNVGCAADFLLRSRIQLRTRKLMAEPSPLSGTMTTPADVMKHARFRWPGACDVTLTVVTEKTFNWMRVRTTGLEYDTETDTEDCRPRWELWVAHTFIGRVVGDDLSRFIPMIDAWTPDSVVVLR